MSLYLDFLLHLVLIWILLKSLGYMKVLEYMSKGPFKSIITLECPPEELPPNSQVSSLTSNFLHF